MAKTELHEPDHRQPTGAAAGVMNLSLSPGWFYGGLIVVLSAWILHGFLQAMLAACVTAIASWPLYTRFAALLPRRISRSSKSLIFTLAMTVFVLAPLMFAFGALVTEAQALILEIAAADKKGIAALSGWRTRHWSGRGSPLVGKVSSPLQAPL